MVAQVVVETLPSDEVPAWVQQNTVDGYFFAVVACALVYDSSEYQFVR
jgi:hypothetical protein